MTAMTFESIAMSPRRAATRRQAVPARPAPQAVVVPQAVLAPRAAGNAGRARTRAGLLALGGFTVGLHALLIAAIASGYADWAAKPATKRQEVVIELAPEVIPPPPPPPPQVQPKPQPQPRVAKAAPPPPLPVVSQAPALDPSATDTVQVATTPAPPALAPAPAPEPAPPVVEKITEPRGYAGYLRNPAPEYPAAAQDRGLEGRVILKVFVLASGKPGDVQVSKSSGHRVLDDAAIKAVLAWAFDPAKRGSTPIDGWVQVPLTFKI